MSKKSDPIAAQIADLADRRSALIRFFGPSTKMLIEYCLDGVSVADIAKRHRMPLDKVDTLVRRRLEVGGRGAAGREFIRALGREDAVGCLEELALALTGSPMCAHCRRGFAWNTAGRPAVYCGGSCRQAAWRRRRAQPGYEPVELRLPEPREVSPGEMARILAGRNKGFLDELLFLERYERGEHPSLAGVRERRHRRACRPLRVWESDGDFRRLTIGRLYDWAFLEAVGRPRCPSSRTHEFYELSAYEKAEEVATRIRIGEPGDWRELDLLTP
ncbi:hypothetical protein Afil01_21150 [Actinorhabdospora filicis]|uniref:Uncharacterized protein n=1 Tax=Actinorhabdospora filicis TaxID=1785913 RepID=A0A9W6SJU5_9ACTN|nr:hypothetical protein [Actinorhabdospora filicis]GLZ77308.1 hypothetical protein Afil01_21150 [Actinorhabdospora filicis]